MKFASTRLITSDLDRLVAFYELVTGMTFLRPAPVFAELPTDGAGTLAIGDASTLALFEGTGLTTAANTSVILEFQVDDVDDVRAHLDEGIEVLQEPTTMPWGNRAMMVLDPDRNRVNLYTPLTEEARERFAER